MNRRQFITTIAAAPLAGLAMVPSDPLKLRDRVLRRKSRKNPDGVSPWVGISAACYGDDVPRLLQNVHAAHTGEGWLERKIDGHTIRFLCEFDVFDVRDARVLMRVRHACKFVNGRGQHVVLATVA